jgi:thiol-disulfide isomerase/thioredoxin
MTIKERLEKYFREKSPLRITTDILFYLLILALLLPFSRKYVSTGLNKLIMHRPTIINESRQISLTESDYDWMLEDLEGNRVSFRSFRGEVIFLSLWATWCPPCRAEMPNIQRLYDEYGERIAMVLASQEDPAALKKYLSEQGFRLPVYRLVQNPPEVFQASTIPTTFLITPEGMLSVRKKGAAKWDGNFFKSYLDGLLESH